VGCGGGGGGGVGGGGGGGGGGRGEFCQQQQAVSPVASGEIKHTQS